jgi:transcriptional regulator with XRE-family HTH domain
MLSHQTCIGGQVGLTCKSMTDNWADHPYKTIGWHLKFAREQLKESLAEVSGAVEIDERTLVQIENGERRPSEEILLLLISHLNLEDAEATSLWALAGYDRDEAEVSQAVQPNSPIVYTDSVDATVNDYGVVLDFMQGGGPTNQLNAVARVGMSKDHAKHLLNVLQNTLNQSDQPKAAKKLLPSPKKRKSIN